MMWLARIALARPYTFVVEAVLIVLGIVSIRNMAKDVFTAIEIPVVSVIWTYSGMVPNEIEKRIVWISERAITTTVNDIEYVGQDA
jgi:multidrug efflux pump subunit AcrB